MARKTVLVTGASAGIGAATAVLAAVRGYDVGIGYRSDQTGAEATAQAVTQAGGRAALLRGDMANPDDIAAIFDRFDAELGSLDAFVNNAGVVDTPSRVEDMSADRVARMVAINLTGPVLACGQAVRRMATRHGGAGGVIVNVSSIAAKLGGAGQYVDYAATKGGIDTLTQGLALENAEDGIRVCGVRPGVIETEIHAKGGQPDRARALAHLIPMKRPGTASEIAATILWLMSQEATYATGMTVDISGGR